MIDDYHAPCPWRSLRDVHLPARLRAGRFEWARSKKPTQLEAENPKLPCKHRSTDFSDGREHIMQKAAPELPGDVIGERYPGVRSTFPSAELSYQCDSFPAENAAVSETVNPTAGELFGRVCGRRIRRSEPRAHLNAPLWLTSLQKPGVFEVVPTENVSRAGVQMLTQRFWDPAEMVLVSSPPGFCLQGSVVYCKKLPSDDYVLGIRLNAPVEHWMDTLGLGKS